MRPLAVERLEARSFRNLEHVAVELGARFNVVAGDNGQGKTNLLEALYVVATSKSFRASKPGDLVAFGAEVASVRATVREDGETREQSVGLQAGRRAVRVDGKRPASLAAYAVKTPCVVFHPGEIALSMGGSAERRRLLDRAALFLAPNAMSELDAYTRAVRARQRVLEARGVEARDLPGWEDLVVQHGLALMELRSRAAERLAEHARAAFARIAPAGIALEVAYAPSAPPTGEAFIAALEAGRATDLRRGSASVGPHRDELALAIAGRPVRGVASQGQHRAVTLALKSAEIDVIGAARGVRPILLLDDVSSELDRARTAALFAFLRDQEGQVFLSTTRPDLIDTGGEAERRDFVVEGGVVRNA